MKEEDRAHDLEEWRQLRMEQNRSNEESLLYSQQKCAETTQRQDAFLKSVFRPSTFAGRI